ncbi:DNA topoisomerase-1 [Pustulibacterium marinum]|uniref:DNA topoisomerase n=1 Tax=Pustulibacterium marinum TaxID=1224947 RepID=A0A1I7H386_9FLAO|nr:DNA topoisomerase IB [Pustulibacterium marinum]SFU55164.1 DNA topoisomerase-1 [Pustulibacterium marinum]
MNTQCPPQLIYVSDTDPGFTRKKKGKKFLYLDQQRNPISRPEVLQRIEKLVIPPMWESTWICPKDNGHIQATGNDLKKRKQYIYHTEWVNYRQHSKFDKLFDFGNSLSSMRRKINEDLKEPDFTYRKTLALAVKLLDCNYLRIGNDFYLNENETYGLTTIRRKHLDVMKGKVHIEYKAKSNKYRKIDVTNKRLVNLLKEINELPGYEVFRYKEGSKTHRICSDDVNQYIREISGHNFSAKDFRTWGGTVTAIDEFENAKQYCEAGANRKLDTAIVRRVSKILGNTVATARAYYIHPVVLQTLLTKDIAEFDTPEVQKMYTHSYLKKHEAIALKMIEAGAE